MSDEPGQVEKVTDSLVEPKPSGAPVNWRARRPSAKAPFKAPRTDLARNAQRGDPLHTINPCGPATGVFLWQNPAAWAICRRPLQRALCALAIAS